MASEGKVYTEFGEAVNTYDPHGLLYGLYGEPVLDFADMTGRLYGLFAEAMVTYGGGGMILLGDHVDQHGGALLGHAATIRAGRGNWRRG